MTPISIHVIYHSSQVIRGLRIDLQLAVQWYTKAVSAGESENKELDDEDQNDWYRCSRARLRALKHNKK